MVDDLRGRAAPIAAAAAVIATFLARPAFAGTHPSGWAEWVAAAVGLVGVGALAVSYFSLFGRRDLAFAVDTDRLVLELDFDDPDTDLQLAEVFARQRDANQGAIDDLSTAFAVALGGLLLEALGFGVATALAS